MHSRWLFTKQPPGGVTVLSKCSVFQPRTSGVPPLVGRGVWRRGRERRGEERRGRVQTEGAGITRTCAGGCKGTGRRWRRTWGRACVPWSSCHPPRWACRSLPSPCKDTCRHTRTVRRARETANLLWFLTFQTKNFVSEPKSFFFFWIRLD